MERKELELLQKLPLDVKVAKTKQRIREFINYFGEDNVYISFSGGKDSTVLLHIVREEYPNVKAVFSNTGLEFPEIVQHVKTFDNVEIIRPKISFKQSIEQHGYPVISKKVARMVHDLQNPTEGNATSRKWYLSKWRLDKETGEPIEGLPNRNLFLAYKWRYLIDSPFKISSYCCNALKKNPLKNYRKQTGMYPIIGSMAEESDFRTTEYLNRGGCNSFDEKNGACQPLGFWTEQDVLQYIVENNIKISSVYGRIVQENGIYVTTGEQRTGCIFCLFGIQYDTGYNRIQRLQVTHPQLHQYVLDKLGYREVMEYLGYPHSIPDDELEDAKKKINGNIQLVTDQGKTEQLKWDI